MLTVTEVVVVNEPVADGECEPALLETEVCDNEVDRLWDGVYRLVESENVVREMDNICVRVSGLMLEEVVGVVVMDNFCDRVFGLAL